MEIPYTLYHLLHSSEEAFIESILELLDHEDVISDEDVPGDEVVHRLLSYDRSLEIILSKQAGEINYFKN